MLLVLKTSDIYVFILVVIVDDADKMMDRNRDENTGSPTKLPTTSLSGNSFIRC